MSTTVDSNGQRRQRSALSAFKVYDACRQRSKPKVVVVINMPSRLHSAGECRQRLIATVKVVNGQCRQRSMPVVHVVDRDRARCGFQSARIAPGICTHGGRIRRKSVVCGGHESRAKQYRPPHSDTTIQAHTRTRRRRRIAQEDSELTSTYRTASDVSS